MCVVLSNYIYYNLLQRVEHWYDIWDGARVNNTAHCFLLVPSGGHMLPKANYS